MKSQNPVVSNRRITTPTGSNKQNEEKEKEYKKTINNLNKQVRTLQKILYHRDPSGIMHSDLFSTNMKNPQNSIKIEDNSGQLSLMERRVQELEAELSRADNEAKQRLTDFQMKLTGLKVSKKIGFLENLGNFE